MSPEDFAPLEISRYVLRLRASEGCRLPAFLGSTLRGAFGHALKEAVFLIDGDDCAGCSAADPCVYHYLFETPVPPGITQLRGQREAPVPFILSPPIVQNPVRRVWRVPSVQAALAASRSLSDDSQLDIDINRQSAIGNRQSAITSVVFPDQARRFNGGDELSFALTLIGRAINYLPYIIIAINVMARRGLGANRAQFELTEVCLKGAADARERIWENGAFLRAQASRLLQVRRSFSEVIRERLAEVKAPPSEETSSVSPPLESTIADARRELHRGNGNGSNSGNGDSTGRTRLASGAQPLTTGPLSMRLRFLTPARIRVKGDLQTGLSFELLVRNLLRRVSTLTAVHAESHLELDYRGLIERAGSVRVIDSRLRWWDLERYTNRQAGKLKVGGLIGEVEYEGQAIGEFLPLVLAGELLNVGTGTSFGLGSYQVLECA
jgi:CRISPR-associated endoribonuclease Cas6